MDPRRKSSALWGVVGALSFLVLAQGYRLATGRGVGVAALAGVAVVVGVAAGILAYAAEPRFAGNKRV